jgi:LPS sulfotransferase NodH
MQEPLASESVQDPSPLDNRSFILVYVPRSGSNLLRDYLNQHESIQCFGEIFKNRFRKGKSWQRFSGGSAELKHLHQTDLVSFWKVILEKCKLDKPVIGAKMSYFHREGEEIWRYFASSCTPIIHLVREELIDSYLSFKLAETSRIWIQPENEKIGAEYGARMRPENEKIDAEYNRTISIDLDDFRHYCVRFWQHFDSIKLLFRDNPYLEITYSALVQEREKTMSEIYSFLGLPSRETSPRLVKQLSRPREELIINWNETASFIKSNDDLCVIH